MAEADPAKKIDGTARLCRVLYGRKEEPKDYLGGSDAAMLHDAADVLEKVTTLRKSIAAVNDALEW